MTLKGKEIVAAFYGSSPTHSYFIGGSSGGGQALMEVQRYPDDYDGVVAGAPTNYWTHAKAAGLWNAQLASVLSRPKLTLLHGAVLAACDSIDAIGFLDDPRQCRFNPETLLCPGDDSPQCLTQTQVEAAKKIYSGPANPRTGETIYPGLEPGSELGWPVNGPNRLFSAYFQYVVHQDPNWNWRNFDLDHDVALADQKGETALNAIDPDLRRFTARGGKLILTHGWSDASLAPQNTIRYYESVGAKLGERSQDFVRLFMVPRMGHGVGGTDQFNALAALERWVEEGVAPDRILAQQVGNIAGASTGVTMERPLCPYPQVARWKGKGSRNDAANFDCASPAAATAK
jgi:feruloyl esterase